MDDDTYKPTFPEREGTALTLLRNGCEIFPAMLEAIRSARISICLETYIYWSGEIAKEFATTLAAKAREGVPTRVLLDWYGCLEMDEDLVDLMEDAGVSVRRFRPPRWKRIRRANHRSHRKLLIVDGHLGFIGGVGIADVWLGNAQDPDHWRDNHYRVEGPVVGDMQKVFFNHWDADDCPSSEDPRYYPPLESAGSASARMVASDPFNGADDIEKCYLQLLHDVKKRFYVIAPYFAPGDRILASLCRAAARDVDVQVITAGRHNDQKVVRNASRHDWGRLLTSGVQIFEYDKTLIHVKLVIIDDERIFIGSANFDARSTRLNAEANLLISDTEIVTQHLDVYGEDRAEVREISLEAWRRRPLLRKLADGAAHLLRPHL